MAARRACRSRAETIQPWLDKRRPGTSRYVTQRREADEVEILSGVFEGVTTGTPIALEIRNTDQRSKDYGDIADKFRPGHADYAYHVKYGVRDYRGGGRSSARETAARVAAGGVARAALAELAPKLTIRAALVQIGDQRIDREAWDWAECDRNPFWCPDAAAAARWADLSRRRAQGRQLGRRHRRSAGRGRARRPRRAGLRQARSGSRRRDDVDQRGQGGRDRRGLRRGGAEGEANADEMRMGQGGPIFRANHAGGIVGGISTGQEIVLRFAVKPTSSILTPRETIDRFGAETEIVTKGRHDPCVGIRAAPVGEAMMACVLLDHLLLDRAQTGGVRGEIG
jgi:chorismate synthase